MLHELELPSDFEHFILDSQALALVERESPGLLVPGVIDSHDIIVLLERTLHARFRVN